MTANALSLPVSSQPSAAAPRPPAHPTNTRPYDAHALYCTLTLQCWSDHRHVVETYPFGLPRSYLRHQDAFERSAKLAFVTCCSGFVTVVRKTVPRSLPADRADFCCDWYICRVTISTNCLSTYSIQFSGGRCGSSAAVRRYRKDAKHWSRIRRSASLEHETANHRLFIILSNCSVSQLRRKRKKCDWTWTRSEGTQLNREPPRRRFWYVSSHEFMQHT